MEFEISGLIYEKHPTIKMNENSPSGSRVVPCRPTDRQTDTKKHVAFNYFAIAPENNSNICV
jgi:hypothetical protein